MHCAVCPHQTEINAALEPCQSCKHTCRNMHDGVENACEIFDRNPEGCKTCPHLKKIGKAMRPCTNCDAGRLHDTIHFDGAPNPSTVFAHALPIDHVPMLGATELHPDIEDALRKTLCVIFDFAPLELLLIQHVVHKRNLASFRKPLSELKERLNTRYDLSEDSTNFRATAHAWKKKIVERFPPIAELFDAVADEIKAGQNH